MPADMGAAPDWHKARWTRRTSASRIAAEALVRQISGERVEALQVLATEPIIRKSTARP